MRDTRETTRRTRPFDRPCARTLMPVLAGAALLGLWGCESGETTDQGMAAETGAETETQVSMLDNITSAISSKVGLDAVEGTWTLTDVGGTPTSELLPVSSKLPYMRIDPDGAISGYSGVNHFRSAFDLETLKTGALKVGDMAMTRMAGTGEASSIENAFVSTLSQTPKYSFEGGDLKLSAGENPVLTFRKGR